MTDGAKTVDIETLILSDELSPREALNEQWVVGYAALMADGVRFPPINVMRIEGRRLFPTDGRHRIEARRRCGQTTIEVYIKDGDWDDAVEEAATANACRGLPLSSSEKRRAVAMMLAQPKLAQASDREIARRCGLSPTTVGAIRAEVSRLDSRDNPLETFDHDQEPDSRRGADGRVYDVSRQGAAAERTRQRERMVEPISGDDEFLAAVEAGRQRGPVEAIQGRNESSRVRVPPNEEDAEIRQLVARSAKLSSLGQEKLRQAWRAAARPVALVDILVWGKTALDSHRRQASDALFDSIASVAERLKHEEKVRAWLDQYERGDASEPCADATENESR